ncbi:MAG: hypothetical protein U0525_00810 [Patescibacteria group bacterium]
MEICLAIELSTENKKLIEKETKELFDKHKEYLWFDPLEYRIPVFTWTNVEDDLLEKLKSKIDESLFEAEPFELFALEYVVKIGSRIDIFLKFQREAKFTRTIRTLSDNFYGLGTPASEDFPMIPIARYKIPAKQQYSHLKNELEKIKTEVNIMVSKLALVKVTNFGQGAKEGSVLSEVELLNKN